MKPTVLICKSGQVVFGDDVHHKIKPDRSMNEEMGVIRHLAQRDDIHVVYFGRTEGTMPCVAVEPNISGLNHLSSPEDQRAGWDQDVKDISAAADGKIVACVQLAGITPNLSWIDNPYGLQPLASAIRYHGPFLNAVQSLALPRIVCCWDPRSYPKEQEMSMGWDHCRPVALLGQGSHMKVVTVGRQRYLRKEVYAKAESWNHFVKPRVRDNTREFACAVMSHYHGRYSKAIKSNTTHNAWMALLKDNAYPVFGNHWEVMAGLFGAERFHPLTKENNLEAMAHRVMCSPIVSHTPGYMTNKMHKLVHAGCIPIFFGRGEPGTYDDRFEIVGREGAGRVCDGKELTKRVSDLKWLSPAHKQMLDDMWERFCQPDWSILDNCLDDLLAGKSTDSTSWFDLYGGYRRVAG